MYTKIISREQALSLKELGMEMKKLGVTERYVALEYGIEEDFLYPSIAEVFDWAYNKYNIFIGVKKSGTEFTSELFWKTGLYWVNDSDSIDDLLILAVSSIINFIPSINP